VLTPQNKQELDEIFRNQFLNCESLDDYDWQDADLDELSQFLTDARIICVEWVHCDPLIKKGKCCDCTLLLEKDMEYILVWLEALSEELVCFDFDKYEPMVVHISYLKKVNC
jgi:hypothetical protein